MKRIYDAAFAANNGKSHHSHLGKFWWEDDRGNRGTWNRDEAHDYVADNPGTVYVSEGGATVYVYAYHFTNDPSVRWIQTRADGTLKDNLLTLARHHS